MKAEYDPSGRLLIKNHTLAERLIRSVLGPYPAHEPVTSAKGLKVFSPPHELRFSKVGRQMFKSKTKPYLSLISERSPEALVHSYKQVQKRLH